MNFFIRYKTQHPRDWDHNRDRLNTQSQTHTKVLLCLTMINLSPKRLLYITFIIPLLLAMLAGASKVPPAKRQDDTSEVRVIPRTLAA